ncbi:MAG: hypothetical protein ACI921_000618 [Polaribacter sp.]|jgi:hypothetical protein
MIFEIEWLLIRKLKFENSQLFHELENTLKF